MTNDTNDIYHCSKRNGKKIKRSWFWQNKKDERVKKKKEKFEITLKSVREKKGKVAKW